MHWLRSGLSMVAAALLTAAAAHAQATTGTITGRVLDGQGLPLTGATVSASSPSLQGTRHAVTSANGDYVFPLLPSGVFTLAVELTGFERQERTATLAPTQMLSNARQIQPVHDDASRGNQLELRCEFRHGGHENRVRVPSDVPAQFRRQVLASPASNLKKGKDLNRRVVDADIDIFASASVSKCAESDSRRSNGNGLLDRSSQLHVYSGLNCPLLSVPRCDTSLLI
jgi:hypothetical protein